MDDEKQDLHLSSIEELDDLDRPLKIITIHNWILLSFVFLLAFSVIAWSIMGTVPVTVSGKCLVFDPTSSRTLRSPISGVVQKLFVETGEIVQEGQPLALLQDGSEVTLRSPISGKISWIDAAHGETVSPNQPVLYVQGKPLPEKTEIYGFLPLNEGESVKPGMDVKCAIEGMNTQKYGMLKAKIKEILPYPVSENEALMHKIPSDTLRNYLISGQLPTILVIAEPILDPNTPSGMKWTSKNGPPNELEPGSIGMIRITLSNMKPIQYFIPSIR